MDLFIRGDTLNSVTSISGTQVPIWTILILSQNKTIFGLFETASLWREMILDDQKWPKKHSWGLENDINCTKIQKIVQET